MSSITEISREVLCLQDEGPDDTYRVPFPVFDKTSIIVRWKRGIQDNVTVNPNFVIRHPDSEVAVMCSTESAGEKEKAYYRNENLFVINIRTFMRVRILSARMAQDDIEFVTWVLFPEEKPTREIFLSDDFQKKVDMLRELAIRFRFRSFFENEEQTIELPPHGFSEEAIGMLVDIMSERVNEFIDENPVKELLLAILEEANVEKRLDKAIALYELCLESVETWEQDSGESRREIPDISRSELVHRRLFGQGLEGSSVEKIRRSNVDRPDDPNDRANLIRRRIFKKGGDKNGKNSSS